MADLRERYGDPAEETFTPPTAPPVYGAAGLRGYGKDVWKIWGAYCDEDIIDLAVAARAALDALADRLENGD
jgi:hypothetical protein